MVILFLSTAQCQEEVLVCTCNVGGHGVGGQAIRTPYIRLITRVGVEYGEFFHE